MAGHCLQFWFSKLLGNTLANGHRSTHRYGWLGTNLNWCPKDCLLLYFSSLSKQIQTTKQPFLSHSQIPNCSSSQSKKAQALLSHTAFHEHSHRCERVGLLHATLLETTITARIAALEHTRFPCPEQHLPGMCPRVQHMNAHGGAKRVRCISSVSFVFWVILFHRTNLYCHKPIIPTDPTPFKSDGLDESKYPLL